MENSTESHDQRYLDGVRYFNQCEFFDAHDAWEELWVDYRGPSREFYQGLIQAAVCLHHFGNGNVRGARKLYRSSRRYLEKYLPTRHGIHIQQLLDDLHMCCREMLDSDEALTDVHVKPELLPKIYLDPQPDI